MAVLSSFDPLAPNATPSSSKHTFRTLERERLNRHPKTTGPDHPALDELVKPHIESFNALMEDSNGTGKGLIQLGVEDLAPRVVFDGKREDGSFGNKISCERSAESCRGAASMGAGC
jgi:DNA-directed RNA polymerase I subunit RPA2